MKLVLCKTRQLCVPTITKPLIFHLFGIIGGAAAAGKLITEALHVHLALIKKCRCSFNNDLRFTQHHDPY